MNRNAIPAWIAGSGNWLINSLFPARCPICGEILPLTMRQRAAGLDSLPAADLIHPACRQLLTPVEGDVCDRCGKLLTERPHRADSDSWVAAPRLRPAAPPPHRPAFCTDCRNQSRQFVQGHSLWLHDRYLSRSIYEFKYAGAGEYARYYGAALAEVYGRQLREWGITALVPVPVHRKRLARRGYNQAQLVAESLSRRTGIPCDTTLLYRIRETGAQKNLSRDRRQRNLEQAFYCPPRPEGKPMPARICLLDDVFTTGSTIDACARSLKQAGASEVYFLTVTTGLDREGATCMRPHAVL